VVNIDDIDKGDTPVGKKYTGSVAKRLRSNKGKVVPFKLEPPIKLPKKFLKKRLQM